MMMDKNLAIAFVIGECVYPNTNDDFRLKSFTDHREAKQYAHRSKEWGDGIRKRYTESYDEVARYCGTWGESFLDNIIVK